MAVYRNIQISFWTDSNVADDYTTDDKLLYLYLLTNPHTNLCGCYEISLRQIAYETGFSVEETEHLIDRAEHVHKTVAYSREMKEVLILKWSKYNWTSSEKFRESMLTEIQQVKTQRFRDYLVALLSGEKYTVSDLFNTVSDTDGYPMDTVSESENTPQNTFGYPMHTVSESENTLQNSDRYPMDTVSESENTPQNSDGYPPSNRVYVTVTDTVTDTVSVTDNDSVIDSDIVTDTVSDPVVYIVGYLNDKCGTKYKTNTPKTVSLIKQRLKEGYTKDDFRTVIDKKAGEWIGTEHEKFLRPETLFGSKFEGYLNQHIRAPAKQGVADKWMDALKIAEESTAEEVT